MSPEKPYYDNAYVTLYTKTPATMRIAGVFYTRFKRGRGKLNLLFWGKVCVLVLL